MSSSRSPRTPNRGVVNWRQQIEHIIWGRRAAWLPLWWWPCFYHVHKPINTFYLGAYGLWIRTSQFRVVAWPSAANDWVPLHMFSFEFRWFSRFKSSFKSHVIEVNLYDEIDFMCPYHRSRNKSAVLPSAVDDRTRFEYYIIYQVRLDVSPSSILTVAWRRSCRVGLLRSPRRSIVYMPGCAL